MYRLYGNVAGWHLLDRCFNEVQLIETMTCISNRYNLYDYLVIEHLDNTDYPYKRIHNKEEFEELLYYYNLSKDIPDISAVELKRQILRRKGYYNDNN